MPHVRKVVDLSHTIGPGMQVYPGDPVPALIRHCTLERDGYNVLDVRIGSQSGTHVDAPAHLKAGAATIECGEGCDADSDEARGASRAEYHPCNVDGGRF